MHILFIVLSAIAGYLLGCIPVGVLISRWYGQTDIRATGSGNSGTTNVLRTLGWLPSVLTLLGDALKGALAALMGKWLGGETGMLIAAFMAVLGHDFPVFTGFKGGKGIATSLGVTFVVCWPVAPLLVLIVVAVVAVCHIMSVGTLTASLSYPILFWLLMRPGADRTATMIFAVALMLLSFLCHRANIARLIRGQENVLNFGHIGKLSHFHFRRFRERNRKK